MHFFGVFSVSIKHFSMIRSVFSFQFSATNKSMKQIVTPGSSSYYLTPDFNVHSIMFSLHLMSREKESWKSNIM